MQAAGEPYRRRKGRSCANLPNTVGWSAKGYSNRHEGDGHGEDHREQPARLANTLVHQLPPERVADNGHERWLFQAAPQAGPLHFAAGPKSGSLSDRSPARERFRCDPVSSGWARGRSNEEAKLDERHHVWQ